MGTLLRHLLALVCGLTLALPPGWCCALAQVQVRGADTTTSGCCHGGRPEKPSAPKVPDGSQPCCFDRSTPPAPDGPKVLAADIAPAAVWTLVPAFTPDCGGVTAPPAPLVHSPPAHVLHCVWLC